MIIKRSSIALCFLLLLAAGTLNATVAMVDIKPPKENQGALTEEQKARIVALKHRVAQIKAIDKSTLSKSDRKELRQELKDINKEAKAMRGKTFVLALGGIIIAILVLILLL